MIERNRRCCVVGVGGPSRGGKTTFSELLVKRLEKNKHFKVKIIHQDSDEYGKDIKDPSFPKVLIKGKEYDDWEHPDSQNFEKLLLDIKKLKEEEETDGIRVVIVDGYFSLYSEEIVKQFDIRVFITLSDEGIRKRREEDRRWETIPSWNPILGDPKYIDHVVRSNSKYNYENDKEGKKERKYVIRNISKDHPSHFVFDGDSYFTDSDVESVQSFILKNF